MKRLHTIWISIIWHSEKGNTIKTENINSLQRFRQGVRGGVSRAQRTFRVVKLILYEPIMVDIWHHTFSKPIDCTTQRVNVNISYKQFWIIMYQYWFISDNRCTTLMQAEQGQCCWEGGGHTGTLSSAQFFCTSRNVLKNEVY